MSRTKEPEEQKQAGEEENEDFANMLTQQSYWNWSSLVISEVQPSPESALLNFPIVDIFFFFFFFSMAIDYRS